MPNDRISRSGLLQKLAIAPLAIGAFAALAAEADAKAPKLAVLYQDKPKDGKKCNQCKFYVYNKKNKTAKGGCTQVSGAISPEGYCVVWAAGNNSKNT